MRAFLFIPVLLAVTVPLAPAMAQSFNGSSVLALHRAGLGDGPIAVSYTHLTLPTKA